MVKRDRSHEEGFRRLHDTCAYPYGMEFPVKGVKGGGLQHSVACMVAGKFAGYCICI